jgi:hypothetical protein
MTGLRSAAALTSAAMALLLCSCGRSGGGGAVASSQAAASSAPPAASSAPAAPSDLAPSSAADSALPPVAAAAPAAAVSITPAAAPAPPKRQPTAAELLRDDPAYIAREGRLEALYGNAKDRDPTGQVEREQAQALAERRACAGKTCLDRWFSRREAALKQYVEN